ncbi:MAG: hypothetical protein IJ604_11275 [Prevotella sp.]|nr:hypothetical protein [Prevotella sp.]MBR1463936.1 hypothetical protein [Prevotella sp.]
MTLKRVMVACLMMAAFVSVSAQTVRDANSGMPVMYASVYNGTTALSALPIHWDACPTSERRDA